MLGAHVKVLVKCARNINVCEKAMWTVWLVGWLVHI